MELAASVPFLDLVADLKKLAANQNGVKVLNFQKNMFAFCWDKDCVKPTQYGYNIILLLTSIIMREST